ncbi:hypothetical membrane protein [Pseudomonas knackmussii B13]|uniref:Hypothetical membrane protein n=1 Tax=Pseudomonas knackmussii (strain DSM 6978 / CCUG 54928 / LMG 23759 / B13) TaxID=1301098 RepID=A0A024HIS5_PSEKB|nr:hypothetical membrane protein [Pseudomonas knackmussii B13]
MDVPYIILAFVCFGLIFGLAYGCQALSRRRP